MSPKLDTGSEDESRHEPACTNTHQQKHGAAALAAASAASPSQQKAAR